MRVNVGSVAGNCGVTAWYGFRHGAADWGSHPGYVPTSGIGYTLVGFINTPGCRDVYDWIKTNKEIVFQSPVKRNRNSGNKFFFIIFKDRQ